LLAVNRTGPLHCSDPIHFVSWSLAGDRRLCLAVRSSGPQQAQLLQRGHSIIPPTSSAILPFSTRSTVVPVKRIFRPVAAGREPPRKSSNAGPVWVPAGHVLGQEAWEVVSFPAIADLRLQGIRGGPLGAMVDTKRSVAALSTRSALASDGKRSDTGRSPWEPPAWFLFGSPYSTLARRTPCEERIGFRREQIPAAMFVFSTNFRQDRQTAGFRQEYQCRWSRPRPLELLV
jgi:hypothetical protein